MLDKDFHILTTNLLNTARTRVLKRSDLFGVFDEVGDIRAWGTGAHGLYCQDMRHLSKCELRLWGHRPVLLSSTVREDNAVLTVDLTNPELDDAHTTVASDTLHIHRSKFVTSGAAYEKIRLQNYADKQVCVALSLQFGADFADMFEIRGTQRAEHGRQLDAQVGDTSVRFGYRGLDDVYRLTRLDFVQRPRRLSAEAADFEIVIDARGRRELTYTVGCWSTPAGPAATLEADAVPGYRQAFAQRDDQLRAHQSRRCRYESSNVYFNRMLARASADLHMLVTDTDYGPYPYAGTPWFNTVFGRDGLISAYQMLNASPDLARGVLSYLAAHQAGAADDTSDAEPGKILHETRRDEMANTGEVPFDHYYGSIDATPLFVSLAGAYLVRSGDLDFVESLWPHIKRAIAWVDTHGDRDGDGYVEYGRRTAKGLLQQGWKDSDDSVFHADGTVAEAPIALCEVQGYVYSARRAASLIGRALGKDAYAADQHEQACALRERFQNDFWDDQLGTFVLALDAQKRPCRVRASNAGHCLFSGIASPAQAARVADQLLGETFFTGWGIRTLASTEARFNPISYHNGSIWPHDNAMIAAGLARYGFTGRARSVMKGLYDASRFFELNRLPELFCGFQRRPSQGPTLYPVACAPQAWAAGGIYLLVDAITGLHIDARAGRIKFHNPRLPAFLDRLRLRRLSVGDAQVDLELRRYGNDVDIQILERRGDVDVLVVK